MSVSQKNQTNPQNNSKEALTGNCYGENVKQANRDYVVQGKYNCYFTEFSHRLGTEGKVPAYLWSCFLRFSYTNQQWSKNIKWNILERKMYKFKTAFSSE